MTLKEYLIESESRTPRVGFTGPHHVFIYDNIMTCKKCNLEKCKGACCTHGDEGVSISEREAEDLNSVISEVIPNMEKEGRELIKETGITTRLPILPDGKCSFAISGDGCTLCAIEKTFRESDENSKIRRIGYIKPISCHLYPLLVKDNSGQISLRCAPPDSRCSFTEDCPPLYEMQKEALIRKFGQSWYDNMLKKVDAAENLSQIK